MNPRLALLTLLTLLAFASNSILCRLALSTGSIDPGAFTLIRLASGAATLAVVAFALRRRSPWKSGSWLSGALLFAYAAAFSFAYVHLAAGTGGLILFGAVQFTMIGIGIGKGERPGKIEWLGLVVALDGLIVLVAPGLQAPRPVAAMLMAIAGAAWGVYSIRGKSARDPVLATGDNFLRSVPFAVIVIALALPGTRPTPYGVTLAVVSGAATSGLGYVLWYAVLPHLTATRAAITQLAVPALVAIGGVLVLGEHVGVRFAAASAMMLGGVGLAVLRRQALPKRTQR